MKKFLVLFMALILVLSFAACNPATPANSPESTSGEAMPTEATPTEAAPTENTATATPTETPKERVQVEEGLILVDFEKGTEGLAFFDLSPWGFMEPEMEIIQDEDDCFEGAALKLWIDGDNRRGVINLQLALTEDIAAGMAQADDYDYFRFWLCNSGDSDVSIAELLVVSDQAKNGCLDPSQVILIDQFGTPVDGFPDNAAGVTINGSSHDTSLSIPAGFTGWVCCPLRSQVAWWEGTTLSAEELKSVDSVTLDMRFTDAYSAEYLVLDQVGLAKAP